MISPLDNTIEPYDASDPDYLQGDDAHEMHVREWNARHERTRYEQENSGVYGGVTSVSPDPRNIPF